tara:strand:- start:39 stop:1007 length:969 start_codon:yes stop_codon:yes gene_type:complete
MRVGSDFSGVGAFDQALIRLGIEYTTVFACDMDKYARQTYIENYGEPKYYPENVYDREIPKEPLDIYMTSPPCQAFSIAGKKKGETDKRGVLFYNSHEFIIKNRPRYFIFENVKGLLSDDNGKTFQRWIDLLAKSVNGNPMIFPHDDSANYHVYHMVLNTKDYGVPQNRERIFIIGIRDDKDNSFRFPKTQHLTKRLKDILEETVSDKYKLNKNQLESIKGQHEHKEEFIADYRTDEGLRIRDYLAPCMTASMKKPDENMTRGNCVPFIKNGIIRTLTPRECFRLQDFPDTFKMPCSDSQMYKQAGNSITVGVLYNILKNLL